MIEAMGTLQEGGGGGGGVQVRDSTTNFNESTKPR